MASLEAAREGHVPEGTERRRVVRRLRAAGSAALPSLVRALASESPGEAEWAGYLLARLGGGRVLDRLSLLVEDAAARDDARVRALDLLARLEAFDRIPSPLPEPLLAASVRRLLDSLETDEDVDAAADLIGHEISDEDLPGFAAELVRHGGRRALGLLETLLVRGGRPEPTLRRLCELHAGLVEATPPRDARVPTVRAAGDRARGLDLLEAGRHAEARRLLERAVAADPGDAEARSFLGVCCLELGDPDGAMPHLEGAASLEPDEPLHHWNLAAAAKASARMCRCYVALQRYLELSDEIEGARERRREARGFVREYQRTMRSAHPGVEVSDLLVGEQIFLRAFADLEAGRYREACDGFQQVIALVPRHYPSWGNLGAAYFAQGRNDDATSCLRHALELNPEYEVARENLKRLEGAPGA